MHNLRSPALLVAVIAFLLASCGDKPAPVATGTNKVGVLIVAHGSESSTWNGMIETLADEVRDTLLQEPEIEAVEVAFLTASSPSIADQMRKFDTAGYDHAIVVPLFLASESSRTNNYFQYLVGIRSQAKALKQLKNEGFDIYFPQLRVNLTPSLDDGNLLKKNILRRVEELQAGDSGEDMAIVLVGYGDQQFGNQMEVLMENIGRYLKIKTDIDTVAYAFCGDVVDYSGEAIVEVINEVFDMEEEILVVPVLLGVDEMLQTNTIQAAINAITIQSKIRYQGDSILPDPKVNKWLIEKVGEALERLR
jgi:uncharacterized lipoprotein YehR (DUF1307 family)